MKKNLIITPTGNQSHFEGWKDSDSFDLVMLYYSDSEQRFGEIKSKHEHSYKMKGEKWKMTKDFIDQNSDFIERYENIWFPDDDILTDIESAENLFLLHEKYELELSQPAAIGYTSHKITRPQKENILRYTNFVEIMCPMMSASALKSLRGTFDLSVSGYGLDFLWPKILNYPKDKIAIIDEIVVEHTSKVGANYQGRFKISPSTEMRKIMEEYSLSSEHIEYGSIKKRA